MTPRYIAHTTLAILPLSHLNAVFLVMCVLFSIYAVLLSVLVLSAVDTVRGQRTLTVEARVPLLVDIQCTLLTSCRYIYVET